MRSINNKPGLFTGLAPNMLLDITWTNDDPVHRRIYVSLGFSELKEVINCRFITQYITTILVCQGQYTSRWHDCFHVPRQVWHIRNESIKSYQLQSKVPKYPLSNLNNVLKFIDLLVCYLLNCTQDLFHPTRERAKEREKGERRETEGDEVEGEGERGAHTLTEKDNWEQKAVNSYELWSCSNNNVNKWMDLARYTREI